MGLLSDSLKKSLLMPSVIGRTQQAADVAGFVYKAATTEVESVNLKNLFNKGKVFQTKTIPLMQASEHGIELNSRATMMIGGGAALGYAVYGASQLPQSFDKSHSRYEIDNGEVISPYSHNATGSLVLNGSRRV